MAFKIVYDSASEYLEKYGEAVHGYILEGLQKGGFIVYEAIKSQAKRYSDDDWSQYHIGAVRGIVSRDLAGNEEWRKRRRKAVITRFGRPFERFSRTVPNQSAGADLSELTRWRLYPEKAKVVAGWMSTKSFTPVKIRDGRIMGSYTTVKGTSLYDSADIGKRHNIGEMMEYGGTVELTKKQRRMLAASGFGKAAARGYVVRKARPIVMPAYFASRQKVLDAMERTIEQSLHFDERKAG